MNSAQLNSLTERSQCAWLVAPALLRLLDPAPHCIRNLPRAGLDSFLDLSRCLILTLLRLNNFDCLHDAGN